MGITLEKFTVQKAIKRILSEEDYEFFLETIKLELGNGEISIQINNRVRFSQSYSLRHSNLKTGPCDSIFGNPIASHKDKVYYSYGVYISGVWCRTTSYAVRSKQN